MNEVSNERKSITLTVELISNDVKVVQVGNSLKKEEETVLDTQLNFACNREISTRVNEHFLTEGHLERARRSIELTHVMNVLNFFSSDSRVLSYIELPRFLLSFLDI
jgi:hypothetical protein